MSFSVLKTKWIWDSMEHKDSITIVQLKSNWNVIDHEIYNDCFHGHKVVCKRVILRYQITDKDFPDSQVFYPIDKNYASLVMMAHTNSKILDWSKATQTNSEVIFDLDDEPQFFSDLRFQVCLRVGAMQRIVKLYAEVWVDKQEGAELADLQKQQEFYMKALQHVTEAISNKYKQLYEKACKEAKQIDLNAEKDAKEQQQKQTEQLEQIKKILFADKQNDQVNKEEKQTKAFEGKYQCPKCQKHSTTHCLVQVHSPDEPMTAHIHCHPCHLRFTK